MRFTRFSTFAATAALGAATVLGGAGIAQAQSSGSLGSLMPSSSAPDTEAPNEDPVSKVGLEITDTDLTGGKGTLTNNTGKKTSCWVVFGEKSNIETLADEAADADLAELRTLLQSVDERDDVALQSFQYADELADGAEVEWDVTFEKPFEAEFVAGALALCNANDPSFATAYDAEDDSTGSLSNVFGSLGSSNADGDNAEGEDAGDKKDTGSLGSVLGSSNTDDGPGDDAV
ncbi:hypothetical protein [Dietzia sp. ANT_WB102]|uniref:hypothetical protein n=1 Tax=Dietzia sp. ANT_WB102 TaxID=2597345 RepID=UPI0011ECAE7D|nr:hypothetical protein [Dietzia sp. ANT_WB102]KAA0918342.1 hypothetical protein FQ137_03010 [Dietzia sp. ANT_WB102]